MTNELPTVGIVVPCWNKIDDTLELIDSLDALTFPNLRLVFVDNGSTDGTYDRIRARQPRIIVLQNPHNLGFAAAVNQGLECLLEQDCDYMLLINSDTVVAPDMVAELIRVAEGNPNVGVLGPKILYYSQPDRIWRLGDLRRRGWPVPQPIGKDMPDASVPESFIRVDYVTGCGMLIRRQVIDAVGMFDASYFMYYEDADFCARVRIAGFQIAVVPRAHMWHKVSASAKLDLPNILYIKNKNRVHFYRTYPHGSWPLLTWAYLLISSLRLAASYLGQGQRLAATSLLHGFWDGCREAEHATSSL